MTILICLTLLNTLLTIGSIVLFVLSKKEDRIRFERFNDWLWSWMLREDESAPFPPTKEEVKTEIKKYQSTVYDPNKDPMAEFKGTRDDFF